MKTFVCHQCPHQVCVCAIDEKQNWREPQHCVIDGHTADFHEVQEAKDAKETTNENGK